MWAKVKRLGGLGRKVKERVWIEEDHGGEGYERGGEGKGGKGKGGEGKGVAMYRLMKSM